MATSQPTICPAGTYCLEGTVSPVPCPPGTYSNVSGAVSLEECRACRPGTECPGSGNTIETQCDLGTYQPNSGNASCLFCEAGTYQPNRGATRCRICREGHYCGVGTRVGTQCPGGTYNPDRGAQDESACLPCEIGHYCGPGSAQMTRCDEGKQGKFARADVDGMCTRCESPTWSDSGSSECDRCIPNHYLAILPNSSYFQIDRADDTIIILPNGTKWVRPEDQCLICNRGDAEQRDLDCSDRNATLSTLKLNANRWRISPDSRTIYNCTYIMKDGEIVTPCLGGSYAGVDGNGYRKPGYHGPQCKLCNNTYLISNGLRSRGSYFNAAYAECIECPETTMVVGVILGGIALFALCAIALIYVLYHAPPCCRSLGVFVRRIGLKAGSYALMPKFKILIALYQIVIEIPTVYEVDLPDEYYEWMSFLTGFMSFFAWDDLTIPGSCMPSYFLRSSVAMRTLLRGLVPLVAMLAVIPLNVSRVVLLHLFKRKKKEKKVRKLNTTRSNESGNEMSFRATAEGEQDNTMWKAAVKGFVNTLPLVLFIAFCFCATVSSGLFAAWSCVDFERESYQHRSYFLRADLSVLCPQYDEIKQEWRDEDHAYSQLQAISIVFIFIWPIGIPLLYLSVLLPSRYELIQKRSTRLVRAPHSFTASISPTSSSGSRSFY